MTEDIILYAENKHLLLDKKWRFKRSGVYPRDQPFAGLENQGATCYLNSLLQCLFHLSIFRNTLFVSNHDNDNKIDSASSHEDDFKELRTCGNVLPTPILGQLQRLFSRLLYSKRSSVDTIDLLESFGWSKAERVEQHDVHEFFSVLLDAIGSESPEYGNKLSLIFAGFNNDHLVCNLCGFKSTREASFMNISLDMPERIGATLAVDIGDDCTDIRPLFHKLLATETLDEDNKWFCESCKDKVIASKFSEFKSLPPALVIQLKRFRYDPNLKRRVKVSTRVTFPYILDADEAFIKSSRTADKMGEEGTSFGTYELASFILHTGTAMGGHYRAYIRTDSPISQWRDFNDSTVSDISVDTESPTWSIKSKLGSRTDSAGKDTQEEALSCIDSYSLNTLVQENVYLLMYTKKKQETTQESFSSDFVRDASLIPSELVTEMDEEQKHLEVLQKLQEIRKNLIECEIYMPSATGGFSKVLLTSPKDKSIGDLKVDAIQAFITQGGVTEIIAVDTQYSRLTKFDSLASMSMGTMAGKKRQFESFGGEKSEALPLHMAGLRGDIVEQLYLEIRRETDPPFVEFNPKDIVLHLYMYVSMSPSDSVPANGFSIPYILEKSSDSAVINDVNDHADVVPYCFVSLGEVTVPGNDSATVADLRCLALTLLTDAVPMDRLLLIAVSECGPSSSRALPMVLSADESSLKKHYHVYSGDKVIVEVIPAGFEAMSFSSQAFKAIEEYQKRIRVFVNNPFKNQSKSAEDVNAGNDSSCTGADISETNKAEAELQDADPNKDARYDIEVAVSLDDSLQSLKDKIAKLLAIPEDVAFHLRKSSNGTQLKDTSQSLRECSFSDGSIAHVQLGAGCKAGEVILHICLDHKSDTIAGEDNTEPPQPGQRSQKASESRYTFIGQLPVSEKMTVLQLKQLLFDLLTGKQTNASMASSSDGCGWGNLGTTTLPGSPHHLRLKDFPRGKLSAPLRDDRQLVKCLLGLSDGRKIAVQVLPREEKIGPNDVILAVRVMLSEHQPLLPVIDLPVPKKSSLSALAKVLLDMFPQMSRSVEAGLDTGEINGSQPALLSIAKGFSTGPPLTVKSALKLKWYQITSGPTEAADATAIYGTIDDPPLALRDGAVIVVRSASAPSTAAAATGTVTQQGDSYIRATLPAVGAGATAVRAKNVLFRKGSTADNLRNKPWEVDVPRVPYKYPTSSSTVDASVTMNLKIQRPPLRERALRITSTSSGIGTGTGTADTKETQKPNLTEESPSAESPLYDLPTPVLLDNKDYNIAAILPRASLL